MSLFTRRVHRVTVAIAMLLALTSLVPWAASAQGNSGAAHLCQKGGYAALVGSGGETFANAGECTSFAAQGGVFATGIIVPAGYSVTYSSVMGACNDLTFGYAASDGSAGSLYHLPDEGCTEVGQDPGIGSGTIGPFETAVIFTVVLTDNTCGATFDSNSGHAIVSGGGATYQVDIADAGWGCYRTDPAEVVAFSPPGNLSVTLDIHP